MNVDWPSVPLSELVDPQRGISYGIVQPGSPVPDGVPIVRVSDVRNGRIEVRSPLRVSADIERAYGRTRLRGGELLITIVGTVGETAIVPPDMAGWNVARAIAVLPVKPEVGPYWVQLGLRSSAAASMIQSRLNTTVQATLNLRDLSRLPIVLPPRHERQAISSILGALDDKIELNRRMNETLEAMARAIFQDWFVAFGPTRAKMEGSPPYLAPDLWALFPDRLDAEGKPEGWREVPLDQIADFLNGLALQKYPGTGDDDLPVIKIAELRAGSPSGSDRASRAIPPQYVVEDGDILFSWSGSLLQRVWTGGRGALNQHLFKVTSKEWPKWLHYLWVDHHLPRFQAIAASKATTMGHIQRHHLSEAMTVIGSREIMKAADELIAPLFQRSLANSLESRTLAATRDLLLPRLMSGELRVHDAERLMETAA
ncbi:restriction endonuclease subunit S [Roseomonas eburnea]|uniref:Restriction endonuclease subunit S n=1 Tax=Neoroseomonas eburnea TaxID=1346889 RepID=A0A9X9X6T4_9PROT|nr:restriction endonuclease subunit S [Neoroseomonas eburnea]MBR0679420.1 restriction endonuclease subunit S [Neoroseomonas eburnea]